VLQRHRGSHRVAEEFLIEPFRERLLENQNFLDALSMLKNPRPKSGSLVCEPNGARPIANRGSVPTAVGALTQREAAARCAALRPEHDRATRSHIDTDDASILAFAERPRAALVSAATDALRDALRHLRRLPFPYPGYSRHSYGTPNLPSARSRHAARIQCGSW
jgi:hypothetical protein